MRESVAHEILVSIVQSLHRVFEVVRCLLVRRKQRPQLGSQFRIVSTGDLDEIPALLWFEGQCLFEQRTEAIAPLRIHGSLTRGVSSRGTARLARAPNRA